MGSEMCIRDSYRVTRRIEGEPFILYRSEWIGLYPFLSIEARAEIRTLPRKLSEFSVRKFPSEIRIYKISLN